MTGIMQVTLGESFVYAPPYNWPVNLGASYGGGYFAGQINVSGTKYNLVVAPKASGEASGKMWCSTYTLTGASSVIDGPTNSATEAGLGSTYEAATFCEGLTIGGYSDWYLPAKNELEVLYYYLKPGTSSNLTSYGSNANAVSPEPISTNYTSGSPAQTSAGAAFVSGGSEAFDSTKIYWSSTEVDTSNAWTQYFDNGMQFSFGKNHSDFLVRAVRRVAA